MSKNITPYQDSNLGKKEQVAQMFDTISENYDGLNRVISFGTDAKWKKKILKMVAAKQPKSILDIATGTGDLAILFANTSATEIIGLDISQGMLDIGKKKIAAQHLDSKIQMVLGDGENIPYPDNYFDAITVAYGVRNFENLEKGLSEILRVLKPNGTVLIQTPFKEDEIYEDYTITSETNRLLHFGQEDHVRIYSVDGLKKRLEKMHGIIIDDDAVVASSAEFKLEFKNTDNKKR